MKTTRRAFLAAFAAGLALFRRKPKTPSLKPGDKISVHFVTKSGYLVPPSPRLIVDSRVAKNTIEILNVDDWIEACRPFTAEEAAHIKAHDAEMRSCGLIVPDRPWDFNA